MSILHLIIQVFLMGYFEHIETGKQTSPNVFAITDNANKPISLEKISCNSIQNSHRRCLCACACKDFGLAYELWAQIEVEEAKQTPPEKEGVGATRTKPNEKLESTDVLKALPVPISKEAREVILKQLSTLQKLHPDKMKALVASFRDKFNIKSSKISGHITTAEHGEFLALEISKIDASL